MNRNKTIDILKGVGIFLVVLGHATFVNDKIITYIFSFHMPLFFIVSGLLMGLKHESETATGVFIRKKLRSMVVPYLCFSICYTIIDGFSVYFQQISLQDLKVNAVCTLSFAGSGPLWFIPTLLLSEVFLYLLIRKFDKLKTLIIGLVIAIVGFIGCYFFEPFFSAHKDSLVLLFFMNFAVVILRSMICMIFLAPGYFIASYIHLLSTGFSAPQCIIGICLLLVNYPLALMNTNPDLHNLQYGNPVLFVICAYLGTIGLYLICNNLTRIKPMALVSFWGKNSLVIMVTHLNFYYLYIGNLFAHAVNPYITRAKSYVFLLNILIVAMLLSSLTALFINKCLPWMVGKSYKSKLSKSWEISNCLLVWISGYWGCFGGKML